MVSMTRRPLLLLLAATALACPDIRLAEAEAEGDDPGECSDGADNDRDGDFDCADELGVWFVFLAEMSDWVDGREVVTEARDRFAARGVGIAVAETWSELLGWLSPRP